MLLGAPVGIQKRRDPEKGGEGRRYYREEHKDYKECPHVLITRSYVITSNKYKKFSNYPFFWDNENLRVNLRVFVNILKIGSVLNRHWERFLIGK